MPVIPEWTPAELSAIRKAARAGLTAAETKEVLQTPLSADAVRDRAKRYGITFAKRRCAHQGTSKLSVPSHVAAS